MTQGIGLPGLIGRFVRGGARPAIADVLDFCRVSPRATDGLFREAVAEANALRNRSEFAAAAKRYEEASELRPDDPAILVQLGNMLKDSDQLDRGLQAYNRAIAIYRERVAASDRRDETDEMSVALADAYEQRGHLHKKLRQNILAADDYRKSSTYHSRPEVLHELRVMNALQNVSQPADRTAFEVRPTESFRTASGGREPKFGHTDLPDAIDYEGQEEGHLSDIDTTTRDTLNAIGDDEIRAANQCFCFTRSFRVRMINSCRWFECTTCGTCYNRAVTATNLTGLAQDLPLLSVEEDFLQSAETLAGDPGELSNRAIVGGFANGGRRHYDYLKMIGTGIGDAGLYKMTFDLLIVPRLDFGTADIANFVRNAIDLLRPGGTLVLGFDGGQQTHNSARFATTISESQIRLPHLSDAFFSSTPRYLLRQEAVVDLFGGFESTVAKVDGCRDSEGRHLVVVRKCRTINLAVMSGIGDAVWSFTLLKAVKRKYGADKIVLHVHDSRDHRRKRSNSLLDRFEFVDHIVAAAFDVHASPPMDDETGHIRYQSAGPLRLSSKERFDYRLIFNSYLEKGRSLSEIATMFDLETSWVDYDFFSDYAEIQADRIAFERITRYVGSNYIVFHYGATIDNTEVGLNRGGLWSAADWNLLGKILHDALGCSIVLIGAPYDLDYAKEIQKKSQATYYFNTIGHLDINETLAVIRRSKFVVSFPSGIGIVGPFLNVPTVVFWRHKQDSYHPLHERAGFEKAFATDWVPPRALNEGTYYPAWYGSDTPDTVAAVILERGWGSIERGDVAISHACQQKPDADS